MAAATARVDGQDKVIAAAQHIVKSLATSKNAAEDMIRILSGFDNRLSSISALFPSSAPSAAAAPEDDMYDGGVDARISTLEARLDEAEQIVLQWEPSDADSSIWDSSSPEIPAEYLSAVDVIISLASTPSILRGRAESVLQIAMARLEDEFALLLVRNAVPLASDDPQVPFRQLSVSPPSEYDEFATSIHDDHLRGTNLDGSNRRSSLSADEISSDLVLPEPVADLEDIADRMIRAGYGDELRQVYVAVRREFLAECLAALGVEKISIEEVQKMEWGILDGKMKRWIHAVSIVVTGLLSAERRTCDQIFVQSEELREDCFAEAAKSCVLELLNFGDAVAMGQRSSHKLFRILGMYEALADVAPKLEVLFLGDTKDFIDGETKEVLTRLGDAVRGTIAEFGNCIQGETSRKVLQGGEIHPLTRYVMNYIGLLADYSTSLNSLLADGVYGGDCSAGSADMTPLGRCVLSLITYLESNIEEKSKLYEDGGLHYIFLMNNILYIVQKVKDSELNKLLGDTWVRKHRAQIKQFSTYYLRASWTKLLSCLKDDGLGGNGNLSGTSKIIPKERLKNFYLTFEEIYRIQTGWKVPDPELREDLKMLVLERVIPAYHAYVGRYRGQLEGGRHSAKYIKYTPEDLEDHVLHLFEGSQGFPNTPRRKP
ncbi:exocyst complex component EXO70B1-like [Typha angustifolia]|uniref:exocyst complex component EXO70B1-like n=1 Tax=Typha angustifolia TaxID=59011 RepID=UPI003C2ACDBA